MRISKALKKKIKLVCALKDKKIRIKENKILLEGFNIIEKAMDAQLDFYFILYDKNILKNKHSKNILNKYIKDGIECIQIPHNLFSEISNIEISNGIIAVAERKEFSSTQLPLNKENSLLLILDTICDSKSIGLIILTALASGACGVIVTKGCVDIYNPKTIRSSMGAIFNIPVVKVANLNETITLLKKNNISIIAIDINAKKNYLSYQYKGKIALLLGNESNGLKSAHASKANEILTIPLSSSLKSFNAALAASVILYERLRQNLHSI
ncbi:MAG: RNA methyltransferase [Candidatus Firestonebacteria bacterium]|nr:RNA methyltransferase [Candidatus Firestonebacteria bacterium]